MLGLRLNVLLHSYKIVLARLVLLVKNTWFLRLFLLPSWGCRMLSSGNIALLA